MQSAVVQNKKKNLKFILTVRQKKRRKGKSVLHNMQAFSVLPPLRLACGLLGGKFRAVVPHGNTMHTRPVTVPVPSCSSSVSLRRDAMQSGDSLSSQRFRLRWRSMSLWRLLLLEHPMRDSWLPSLSGDPLLCNSSLTSALVSVAAPWLYLSHSEADKWRDGTGSKFIFISSRGAGQFCFSLANRDVCLFVLMHH